MIQNVLDSTRGFKILKILNKENFFLNIILENAKIFTNFRMKVAFIKLLPKYIFESLFVILICISVIISFEFNFSLNEFLLTLTLFAAASIRLIPCANSIFYKFF